MRRKRLPRARVMKVGAAAPTRPPRAMPVFVRWSIRLGTLHAQFAWLMAVVGLVICIAVLPRITRFARYTQPATAVVLELRDGSATYQFSDTAGGEHLGHAPILGARIGDTVRIWYDARDADRSAPYSDVETDHPGDGAYALLVWPFVAIVLAGLFMWRPRMLRLLRFGQHTPVRPVRNSGDEFVITFDYVTEQGARHTNQIPALRSYAGREDLVVMYAPWNPVFAIVLAELPTRPRLDGDRFVATTRPLALLALLALPLATLAASVLLAFACLR